DDLEGEWNWTKRFDFIVARFLSGCFESPQDIFCEAYKHLEPGGSIEVHDIDFVPRSMRGTVDGTHLQSCMQLILQAAELNGRPLICAQNYEGWMKGAGFIQTKKKVFPWPLNGWAKPPHKRIGLLNKDNFSQWLEGLCMALFTRVLHWTEEEVRMYCAKVQKELSDPKMLVYFEV
ncbi:hypothetical protein B0H63DRAFT_405534, partial [Podospora didyma]